MAKLRISVFENQVCDGSFQTFLTAVVYKRFHDWLKFCKTLVARYVLLYIYLVTIFFPVGLFIAVVHILPLYTKQPAAML